MSPLLIGKSLFIQQVRYGQWWLSGPAGAEVHDGKAASTANSSRTEGNDCWNWWGQRWQNLLPRVSADFQVSNQLDFVYNRNGNWYLALIFCRKAHAGELSDESGLGQLARLTSINVEDVGVIGAKSFFEAKIEQQLVGNKFQEEIVKEQQERRQSLIDQEIRRERFLQRAAVFGKN